MTDNTYTRWAVTATDQELRTNLLTLDHRGRDAKEAALEELLRRERQKADDEQAEWDGGRMV